MRNASDDQYLSEIREVDFTPVFILGVHRSGTSILYKTLSATGCFNPVTAYHIIDYHELLRNYHQQVEESARQKLTEMLREQGLRDRKIDKMEVTADLAEEYGFLLNEQTIRMYLSSRNIALFMEMCKKIQFIAGNSKPLLLKNPYDFPNFLFMKQMFPSAKFIFIHRHPLKTISSTLKAFQVIFKDKHPYMAKLSRMYEKFYANPLLLLPFRIVFRFIPELGVIYITMTTSNGARYYLKNIGKLPKKDYIAITYEEFCVHPQKTVEDIMHALALKADKTVDAAGLMNPRKTDIDSTVQKLLPYISRSLRKYCEFFGYKIEKETQSSTQG